jgi:hypothetical protein
MEFEFSPLAKLSPMALVLYPIANGERHLVIICAI